MKVVFIAAHPDDIEFGCAGTIYKLISKGFDIHWILLTNGEKDINKSEKIRIDELNKSAALLGVKNIHFLGFVDGEVTANGNTVKKIADIVNKLNPDLIFTHYYNDRHQDHRNTAYSVRSACWGKYNIIYFNSFSSVDFQPNLFVDISSIVLNKKEVIGCYESQIKKYMERDIDFIEIACAIDKKNGGDIHCKMAEGYQVLNCVWNV
ncbi:MAG: PIG-L deacetylase family protein [Eubacterium sp.]